MPEVPLLLGMADRGLRRRLHTDLLGVGPGAILPFYPQTLSGLVLLVAIRPAELEPGRIVLVDRTNPDNLASVELNPVLQGTCDGPTDDFVSQMLMEPVRAISPSAQTPDAVRFVSCAYASHMLMPLPCPPLFAREPGQYEVLWETGTNRTSLGNVTLGFAPQAPLQEEEKRALLSNPSVSRAVLFQIECTACGDRLAAFETLDEEFLNDPSLPSGAIRIPALPEQWRCRCGKNGFATKWLKAGVPFIFRNQPRAMGEGTLSLSMPYHHERLASVAADFRRVVSEATQEEELQNFIERNPIIWSFLSPKRILHKPRILTHYTADFGVLTAHKTLYLVEIEKPSTALATRAGGRHSEVQQPFNQIRNWREVVASHRLTLLMELGLSSQEVLEIRYLAVAGRSTQDAARIRADLSGDTTFLTFDELAAYLTVLHSQIVGL